MAETFGQRLSRLRKEKGLTQEDIAKRIIISPQAVSKWENDISSPDILVLSSLADILGVSVDVLLGREEESSTEAEETETVETERVEPEAEETESAEESSEKKTRESVHIDESGIHVVGEDGERVDIDYHGVHVVDGDERIHIGRHRHDKVHIVDIVVSSTLFGLALIGYIIMGIFWKEKNMGWSMGWILFLIPIVVSSVFNAVRHKKFTNFAYPILVVGAYCTIGFLGNYFGYNGWGTYWFLFITIPVFYLIFGPIDKYVHRNDPRYDDDDDNDDD